MHDIRVANKTNKQLNDIEDMKVISPEIQEWLQTVWFPKAIETGLKYFAFVVPKSMIASLSMQGANNKVKEKTGIDIQYFSTRHEADSWLISK